MRTEINTSRDRTSKHPEYRPQEIQNTDLTTFIHENGHEYIQRKDTSTQAEDGRHGIHDKGSQLSLRTNLNSSRETTSKKENGNQNRTSMRTEIDTSDNRPQRIQRTELTTSMTTYPVDPNIPVIDWDACGQNCQKTEYHKWPETTSGQRFTM